MGFVVVLSLLMLIFVLMDLYFLKSFKKFIIKHSYPQYLYKSAFYFAGIAFVLLLYNMYFRIYFGIFTPFQWGTFVAITIWYMPKLVIVPILIGKDLILLAKKKIQNESLIPKSVNLHRRKLIQTGAWALAATPYVVVAKSAIHTTYNLKLNNIPLKIKKLPAELSGFKICHITDLHAGSFPNGNLMMRAVEIINAQEPDIVVITGDFVNFDPNEFRIIKSGLSKLQSRYGTYACLGNHDHYMTEQEHNQLISSIKESGIKLLINENVTINKNGQDIQIAGIDDLSFKNTFGDFDLALANLNPNLPTIMLAHDPTVWGNHILRKRNIDLTLSGHTHGGQMQFNYLFGTFAPAKMIYKYWLGLYSEEQKYLYVNAGLGTTGPPIRIGVPPEITCITLLSNSNLQIV